MNNMVLLREYDTPQEAYIVKGMLEANGIESFISVSPISSVFPAPDAGTGTTAVYVPVQSMKEAQELLTEHGDM